MKSKVVIAIAFAILLVACPVYSSTWTPTVEWVIEIDAGDVPWRVFQVSEHFRWEVKPERTVPLERIYAAETLVHYALEDRRQPVAAPEPSTLLLLGTGLVGVMWRKKRWSRHTN